MFTNWTLWWTLLLVAIMLAPIEFGVAKKGEKKAPAKRNEKKATSKGVKKTPAVSEIAGTTEKPSDDAQGKNTSEKEKKLLIILIDGVNVNYLANISNLPGLRSIVQRGAFSNGVTPIYPTKSYPNWYSISTGLHAESHGMTGNVFYDHKMKKKFVMHDKESFNSYWWSEAEPIWIAAEKAGHKVGMFYWDGCQIKYPDGHANKTVQATYCRELKPFEEWFLTGTYEADYYKVFNMVLENFQNNKWKLAMVYFEAMDALGHKFGTQHDVVSDAIRMIDRTISHLLKWIKRGGLESSVNVVVVSDHGMADFGPSFGTNFIKIADYVSEDSDIEEAIESGSYVQLHVKNGVKVDDVINKFSTLPSSIKAYKREDIPEDLHFKNHDSRIGDILLIAKKEYQLLHFNQKLEDINVDHGAHGWEVSEYPELKTFMAAVGPSIKPGLKIPSMHQVDHYNLFCHLLGIKPRPNNGSSEHVSRITV